MGEYDITTPDGTVYPWQKSTPPTQADIDQIVKFHASQAKPVQPPAMPGRVQPSPLAPVAPNIPGLQLRPVPPQAPIPRSNPLDPNLARMAQNIGQMGILGAVANNQPQTPGIAIKGQGKPKRVPLTRADFNGPIAFTYDQFMRGLNEGTAVQTSGGGAIPLARAMQIVTQMTGKSDFAMSQSQSQAEEAQTLRQGSGVGKTVGFNKGQTDEQVPRGTAAKKLAEERKKKTASSFARDTANKAQEDLKGYLRRTGVPDAIAETLLSLNPASRFLPEEAKKGAGDLVAGLGAGVITSPLNTAAELQTTADVNEDPKTRAGALGNLAIEAAGTKGGEVVLRPVLSAIGKLAAKGGAKGLETLRGLTKAAKAGDAAAVEKAAIEIGMEPTQAKSVAAKLTGPFNDFDKQGNPINVEKPKGNIPEPVKITPKAEPPVNAVENAVKEKASVPMEAPSSPVSENKLTSPVPETTTVNPASPTMPDVASTKGAGKSSENVTSLKMSQRAKEAETLGTAEPQSVAQLSNEEAYARGKANVEAGLDPYELVKKLGDEDRPAKGEEYGAIQEGRRRILQRLNEAHAQREAAIGTATHAEKSKAYDEILAESYDFDKSLERVKGASGGSLNALKIGATIDEGNFAAVRSEARARKGSELSPKEEARIASRVEALNRELEASKADNAKLVAQAKADAEKAFSRARSAPKKTRGDIQAIRKEKVAELNKALLKASSSANSGLPLSDLYDASRAVAAIAKTYVDEGALTLSEVLTRMRGHLAENGIEVVGDGEKPKGEGPHITERQIYDAIAGKHELAAEPTEAQARLAKIKAVARITSQMHDVLDGVEKGVKTSKEVDVQFKAMRSQLNEMRKQNAGPKADTRLESLTKQIDDAIHTLAYGKEAKAVKPPDTPEITALRNRLKEVKDRIKAKDAPQTAKEQVLKIEAAIKTKEAELEGQYRNLTSKPRTKPIQSEDVKAARAKLADVNRRLKEDDTINELERQLREKDFPEAPTRDKRDPNARIELLRSQVRQEMNALKPKEGSKTVRFLRDVAGIPRTLKTSFDLSAPLRQGAMVSIAHPQHASRAFKAQLKAFADPVFANAHNRAILDSARAPVYKKAGLYLSDMEATGVSAHEEEFLSKLAGYVPGVKNSERAYTTYLNTMRASVFDSLTNPSMTDAELKGIANFVNVATGRGNLGAFDKAANGFAQIMFSPRYLASRIQVLTGQPLRNAGGRQATRIIAQEYAKYVAAIGTVIYLAKQAGADVELTNYESPDWLKIKVGDSRIDVLSGLQQTARFAARMVAARGDGRKAFNVAEKFATSKLAPTPGVMLSAYTGKDFSGADFDPKDAAKDLVTPMILQDTYEAMKAQGIPAGFALGILSGLGGGVSSYKPGEKDKPVLDFIYEKAIGK